MRHVLVLVAMLLASVLAAAPAAAKLVINVDKSRQRMTVVVDGVARHSWTVSTGRAGYGTPNGVFRPQRLEKSWFSREYYNSPMPHSIFFHRGYAIHGSYEISRLGGPASHGCIRLHPGNAAALFGLVRKAGLGDTTIVVTGANPPGHRGSSPGRPSGRPAFQPRPLEPDGEGGAYPWRGPGW
jgi:lipoprotein-anchoring transpeptidase ErfK/SrfK